MDVIIDCFHFIPFFTPLYIKNKTIIALINEVAGKIWFENLPFPLAYVGYKLEPLFLRLYKNKKFITGSESAKKDLIKDNIPAKNIEIIHHGFTPFENSKKFQKEVIPQLIFLGRISKDKGIEDAVRVVSLLKNDYKDIGLWIVGKSESSEYLKNVKNLISDLKLNENCNFLGFVDEKKKNELLQRAWILIHPSIKEGWGLNVIEANHVGTPAVGYNVSGLVDSIQDGKTGLLVDSNINSLYEGVKKLIEDKKMYKMLSEKCVAWATSFNWEKAGLQSYKLITTSKK